MECVVYRCKKQDEMYLYLRADLQPESLPEALRKRTGALTAVMNLTLTAERKLARVDVKHVMAALESRGLFLQMPPDGLLNPNLHFGD